MPSRLPRPIRERMNCERRRDLRPARLRSCNSRKFASEKNGAGWSVDRLSRAVFVVCRLVAVFLGPKKDFIFDSKEPRRMGCEPRIQLESMSFQGNREPPPGREESAHEQFDIAIQS